MLRMFVGRSMRVLIWSTVKLLLSTLSSRTTNNVSIIVNKNQIKTTYTMVSKFFLLVQGQDELLNDEALDELVDIRLEGGGER